MQILLRKLLRPLPPPQPIDSQRPSSFVLATGSLSYTRSWTAHKKGPYTQSQNAISNCRTLQHGAEVQKGRICRIKAGCWRWAEGRRSGRTTKPGPVFSLPLNEEQSFHYGQQC